MFIGTLRDYQQGPCLQMIRNGRYVLALRTGLGKTETAICAAEDLMECGQASQVLVVTNAATKDQWAKRITGDPDTDPPRPARTDHGSVMVIEGTPEQRASQYRIAATGAPRYVITNYELVRDELAQYQALPAEVVIVDEASFIKNPETDRAQAVQQLHTRWRWAMTATPVENKLLDLWGIMRWVEPALFGPQEAFERAFMVYDEKGRLVRYRNLPLLHEMMAGRWAVVSREMVADQLPLLATHTTELPITPGVSALYDQVTAELLECLTRAAQILGKSVNLMAGSFGAGADEAAQKAMGAVMSRFTVLRHLSSDPRLIRESARRYEDSGGDDGSAYAWELADQGLLADLPETTPKIEYIRDTLEGQTVVFTSYSTMADLLGAALGDLAVVYHGGKSKKVRREVLRAFKAGEAQVLVATDAGGYGLDLPEASRLINHDLTWGGGAMKQRDGRHDRISSTHAEIVVERLITKGAVDAWMADKVDVKQRLGEAVTEGKHLRKGSVAANGDSLREFLESNRP